MNIIDIMPVIIPGIIIQFLIQAFYIKHCWENNELSPKQKTAYILAIAIFNIPAAAIYLFFTRKKTAYKIIETPDTEVDSHIKQGIIALLITAYEIFSLRVIIQNIENNSYSLIIGLLGSCFAAMLVNMLIIKRKHGIFYYILPAVMILLIMLVEYLDNSYGNTFIVFIVIAGIINKYPLSLSKIYSIGSFVIYFIATLGKAFKLYGIANNDEIISYVYLNYAIFLLVFITFYTLKKQLIANKQLEIALTKLKEQSVQLEQMSAMAERNRIAGEIHDTVGHTLTSAVIAIEAGEKLVNDDRETALEKFSLAKEQVKRGLNDIRSSVKAIHTGTEKAFGHTLETLLYEIYQNTGLHITHVNKLTSDLLPIQQNVIISAIKECATNSLKHGGSTEADLLLQEYKERIWMTFSDNGTGSDSIEFGFGLKNMKERVESIGGVFTVESFKDDGFTVNISIPIGKQIGGNGT